MKIQPVIICLLLAMMLTIAPNASFTQSPVGLSATVGAGLLLPQSSQLKGDIYSTYDYPLSKTGYNIDGKVRLNLPALPFAVIARLSYNSLSDEAVLPVATINGIVNNKFTHSLSLFSVALGIEYTLVTGRLLSPYVGVGVAFNSLSGKQTRENDIIPASHLNSATRFGIDIGIGTMINVQSFPVAFDVNGTFRLANLFGKQFGTSYGLAGFGGISQTSSYDLNDAANPADPKDHSRSLNYFTVTLGISYRFL